MFDMVAAIEPLDSEGDKLRGVLHSAFMVRSLDNRGLGNADRLFPVAQRAKGWETFKHFHMVDFARECMIADGYHHRELAGMGPVDLVRNAMGMPHYTNQLRHPAEVCGQRGLAYHTTGSLAQITLDAFNKNLQS